jgi:hypothetical protein
MAAIRITGSDTQTGNLTMQDSNGNSASTIHVNRGEVVTWEIQNNSGVSGITQISPKADNPNLFSSGPQKLPGSAINWQGTIAQNPNGTQEFYFIDWLDGQGTTHRYDPLIQLNPGPIN